MILLVQYGLLKMVSAFALSFFLEKDGAKDVFTQKSDFFMLIHQYTYKMTTFLFVDHGFVKQIIYLCIQKLKNTPKYCYNSPMWGLSPLHAAQEPGKAAPSMLLIRPSFIGLRLQT